MKKLQHICIRTSLILFMVLCLIQTTSVKSAAQEYTASGAYTYNSGVLTWNASSSDFICEGPEVGMEETFTVLSVTETQMTWQEEDNFQMIWNRDPGTAGDILGSWQMTEGQNSYQLTLNQNLTFSVAGTVTECGDHGDYEDPSEEYSVWTGTSRTMTAAGTTDREILHFHIWAPQGTVTQVVAEGPSLANPVTFTEHYNVTKGTVTVDDFSMDVDITIGPSQGDTYTLTVSKASGSPETYTQTINTILSGVPEITSPTGHDLVDANLGQTLNIEWTIPEGIGINSIHINGGVCTTGEGENVEGTVSSTTTGTIMLPELTGATGAYIDIRVHHANEVFMNTKYDFGSCDYIPETGADLAGALIALQILAGLNPAGVDSISDLNSDQQIGLEEAITILQQVAGFR